MTLRYTLLLVSLFTSSTRAFTITTAPISTTQRAISTTRLASSSAAASSSSSGDTTVVAAIQPGDTYVRCGKCQAVYPITVNDLGTARGKGRRLECSVCSHSWFQSKDRLLSLKEGFSMIPLPQMDLDRIAVNIEQGRDPKHMGDCKLYVGNIAFACHEDDLYEVFSQIGEGSVGEVNLVRDDTGKNRGFGFVTMRTNEEGQRAIAELNGTPVRGRNIAVRESNN